MEEVIRKKLNLLVHLAKIDGNFDATEKEILESLLKEAGLDRDKVFGDSASVNLNDFIGSPSRADILYWAMRIIKADGHVHPDEAAYCKALAVKLQYKPDIVEYYSINELGDPSTFKKRAAVFASSSV